MLNLRKSNNWEEDLPGTWRNYRDGDRILECSPVIVDPNEHYLSIHKHTVLQDGTVQPSVACPVEGCVFHDFVRLEGWG